MKYTLVVVGIAILARIILAGAFPYLVVENDSADYYDVGRSILTNPSPSTIINPHRTPIYPFFVASIVRMATGGLPELYSEGFMKGAQMILIVQGILGVFASVLWYKALLLTGLSRKYAFSAYVLCVANIAVLAWERHLMTEGIAVSWLLIETYLLLRLQHRFTKTVFVLTALFSSIAFLLRPAFLLIPPIALLSLTFLTRIRRLQRAYILLGVFLLAAPFVYGYGNWRYHGYRGITYFSDINLMGIIMQGNIPKESGMKFPEVYSALSAYTDGGGTPYVFDFIVYYDRMIFVNMQKMTQLQHFARTVLLNNPIRYLTVSARAIPKTFSYHAAFHMPAAANFTTKRIFRFLETVYDSTGILAAAGILLCSGLILTTRQKKFPGGSALFLLGAIVITQSLMTSFFVYEADPLFKRIMAPVQYHFFSMLFILICLITSGNTGRADNGRRRL